MTFEPLSDRFIHRLERSLDSATSIPSASPLASPVAGLFLSEVPDQPLNWLWPGRLPLGHLTLLDASPGSDPSQLALTLAACISRGKPLPGGTLTQPGNVILYAPYDSAPATLKPCLQAAGGDPARVLLFRPPVADASRTHSFALPRNLDHLANTIRLLGAQLVILDPASAIPGLLRCLPALSELARQTGCAILLIRSLSRPPADPIHPSCSPAPLYEAVRSHLLLIPDPADERHHLLLTIRHPFCAQPDILAYDIPLSDGDVPTLRWLAARDHTHLARLSTGPLHSPQRQAILRFLQENPGPRSIPDILEATCYDHEAGRKMLIRMKMAGELISPARGLYTTSNHPSLTSFTGDSPSVPNVPTNSDMPSSFVSGTATPLHSSDLVQSNPPHCDAQSPPVIPLTDQITNLTTPDSDMSHVPGVTNPPERAFSASFTLDAEKINPTLLPGEG